MKTLVVIFLILCVLMFVLFLIGLLNAEFGGKKAKNSKANSKTFTIKSGNKVNITVKSDDNNRTEIDIEQSSDL